MNAVSYLDSFINTERHLGQLSNRDFQLDRMRALLDKLGNPQDQLNVVHVAGTKGKGSTCLFLAEILRTAGYTVGLYTSPHFNQLHERIRILNLQPEHIDFEGQISDDDLNQLLLKHHDVIESMRSTDYGSLTFFEVLTAMAFCYFLQENVDVVVLETGLGGRLDATNTAPSLLCGITPISLEHTHILGDTLGAIAQEKAAIIKSKGQRVVVAPQKAEAMHVIAERCRLFDITPEIVNVPSVPEYCTQRDDGYFQQANAAMAMTMVRVLRELGFHIDNDHIQIGINRARWPGRFEVIHYQGQTFILDGAHNDASLTLLQQALNQYCPNTLKLFILGVSSDKNVPELVQQVKAMSDMLLLTKAVHPRSYDFTFFRDLEDDRSWAKTGNLGQAMGIASEHYKKHVVVVTGSLFLVAEARRLLIG